MVYKVSFVVQGGGYPGAILNVYREVLLVTVKEALALDDQISVSEHRLRVAGAKRGKPVDILDQVERQF